MTDERDSRTDRYWVDLDGQPRAERRTGEPWRRQFHGRMDAFERRLEDGDKTMSALAKDIHDNDEQARDRGRLLASDVRRGNEMNERLLEQLAPIAKVFKDTETAEKMVKNFQNEEGAKNFRDEWLTLLRNIGAAGAGVAVIFWVIVQFLKASGKL